MPVLECGGWTPRANAIRDGKVSQMGMEISRIEYAGWPNCYRLGDGKIEVVATADVGPRVIRCGFTNEVNLFGEIAEDIGKTGGDQWRIYGGHRLWHNPEKRNRTYWPDNTPVDVKPLHDGIHIKQPEEPRTGIRKEIIIRLDSAGQGFEVEHRMTNNGPWTIKLSLWALSVMNLGGLAITPQFRAPDSEGLLPNRCIALWPYSDMSDPRVIWGERYIFLKQDPKRKNPFKFGLTVPEGWAAYWLEGYLFLKAFTFDPRSPYPDYGVNVELYTNDKFLEMETLSALLDVAPGETASHNEKWFLFRDIEPLETEREIQEILDPLVKEKILDI